MENPNWRRQINIVNNRIFQPLKNNLINNIGVVDLSGKLLSFAVNCMVCMPMDAFENRYSCTWRTQQFCWSDIIIRSVWSTNVPWNEWEAKKISWAQITAVDEKFIRSSDRSIDPFFRRKISALSGENHASMYVAHIQTNKQTHKQFLLLSNRIDEWTKDGLILITRLYRFCWTA